MNRYGDMAMRIWVQRLPECYAGIRDHGNFFTVPGEIISVQIEELADEIAGDDPPGEDYLGKLARLTDARNWAEETILGDLGLLAPGDDDLDGDDPESTP